MAGIGELNQTDLHEQLKEYYRRSEGETEVEIGGFVVDVHRSGRIFEIQTRNLGKLKRKLSQLVDAHRVTLVHPIAAHKYIDRIDDDGTVISHRRSPKRGRVEDAFRELSAIADLLLHPNLTVEIALVNVTEIRIDDGRGSWRRRGVSIVGRRLDEVVERHLFRYAEDYLAVLPAELPDSFTNRDLCEQAGLPYAIVQPITSTLRKMALIDIAGRNGNVLRYRLA